jgi:hypothetical protein
MWTLQQQRVIDIGTLQHRIDWPACGGIRHSELIFARQHLQLHSRAQICTTGHSINSRHKLTTEKQKRKVNAEGKPNEKN